MAHSSATPHLHTSYASTTPVAQARSFNMPWRIFDLCSVLFVAGTLLISPDSTEVCHG